MPICLECSGLPGGTIYAWVLVSRTLCLVSSQNWPIDTRFVRRPFTREMCLSSPQFPRPKMGIWFPEASCIVPSLLLYLIELWSKRFRSSKLNADMVAPESHIVFVCRLIDGEVCFDLDFLVVAVRATWVSWRFSGFDRLDLSLVLQHS